MYYARHKITGIDHHATEAGLRYQELICPVCEATVYLRAGADRAPHFAHISGAGTYACELYHPSLSVGQGRAGLLGPSQYTPWRDPETTLGLVLKFVEELGYTLQVRIPAADISQSWSGHLRVSTEKGERQLDWKRLCKPYFASVRPSADTYVIQRIGEVDTTYFAKVCGGVPGLLHLQSWFRASRIGGRLLEPQEPIHWGESYCLLALDALLPPDYAAPVGLAFSRVDFTDGWVVLEIGLPEDAETLSAQQRKDIEAWCCRPVVSGRPQLAVLRPLPHTIELDGTITVADDYADLKVRVFGGGQLIAKTLSGMRLAVEIETDNIATIKNDRAPCDIWLDQTKLARVWPRPCVLMAAPAIRVRGGSHEWFLFENEKLASWLRTGTHPVHRTEIVVPDKSYVSVLSINGNCLDDDAPLTWDFESGTVVTIDAGSFGAGSFAVGQIICGNKCPEYLLPTFQYLRSQAVQHDVDYGTLAELFPEKYASWLRPLRRRWPIALHPHVINFLKALAKDIAR